MNRVIHLCQPFVYCSPSFSSHKGKDLVNVSFIQQAFVEHLPCVRWALETWLCFSVPCAQQHPEFRGASESFEQMNGLFSTGGWKAPQSSRIIHLHGQHHCVENEVSFQDH